MGKKKHFEVHQQLDGNVQNNIIYQIQSHPGVQLDKFYFDKRNGDFIVRIVADVSLPSKFKSLGETDKGVRAQEEITLCFDSTYPCRAPVIKLRSDFNQNFPHINPRGNKDFISPCIYFGHNDDLINHPCGLYIFLDHLIDWLHKAARNELIDQEQGWEPIRRDTVFGTIDYDESKLINSCNTNRNYTIFKCDYFQVNKRNDFFLSAKIEGHSPIELDDSIFNDLFNIKHNSKLEYYVGKSLYILFFKNKAKLLDTSSTFDMYHPEDVDSFGLLVDRMASYGFNDSFSDCVVRFENIYNKNKIHLVENYQDNIFPVTFFVGICIPRPLPLIGRPGKSNLEIITYGIYSMLEPLTLMINSAPASHKISKKSKVAPLAHVDTASPELFRSLSGTIESAAEGSIGILGCGSIGSKVALHLVRIGRGPLHLFDNDVLSPHNLARHGAVFIPLHCTKKAINLEYHIKNLGQKAYSHDEDFITILNNHKNNNHIINKSIKILLDTTASAAIRNAISSNLIISKKIRILSGCLYSNGLLGILTIEGQKHNPTIHDLYVKLYDLCIDDPMIRRFLSSKESEPIHFQCGSGCGSLTMLASDIDISFHSANIAKILNFKIEHKFNAYGELYMSYFTDEIGEFISKNIHLEELTILNDKNNASWIIRIFSKCVQDMRAEMEKYSPLETGGILFGHISYPNKILTITRLIEAPSDSIRTITEFTLGVVGLKQKLIDIHLLSNNTLTYLGIWHSHPCGGKHSEVDANTFEKFKKHRFGTPSISLVITPDEIYNRVSDI
ncbi:MAG: ThiF family adenylyltransferase [Thermodesulfobacteriota bacterium]